MNQHEDRAIGVLVLCILLIVLLACIASCVQGAVPRAPRAGDANVMVVTQVVYPVSAAWWRQSRWYDFLSDTETPNRVVISGSWACVQGPGTIDDPRSGQAFHCAEGWRSGPHKSPRR